ncbi:ABC transporter substrate-binding protein [Acetobacter conturbans]|uniref:Toluene transporter n=1 Tax=Acetobacter conturbans TaxID=1737472 RepID=A0ABX0K3E1_9PROT|nr:ABC transporter substrate-binding protein [Acetobacter conturbans]NHN89659.1 toluene transporter [Acetobacter conturbans]
MIKFRLSTLSAFAFGAALSFSGVAAHAQTAVTTPIQALDQALDSIQQEGSGNFTQRSAKLTPVVDQAYDLETVLRSSVGASRYMQLSADEKQQLLSVFREYTVARYLSSFKRGAGAKFTLSSDVRPSPVGSDQIVTTHIGSDENMPGTEIDYVMRQENGSWKIVDVLLEGHISQAAAQRSDFGSTLSSGGVNGLIAVLNKKVKTFAED